MPAARKLRAVTEREGNPSREPVPQGVRLPPKAPDEPAWLEPFPAVKLGSKPSRPPARPATPPKTAGDAELEGFRFAKLAWLIEAFAHRAEVREYEARKRLQAEAIRCRAIARATWHEIVPWLDSQGLLSQIDAGQLKEFCVAQARIDQAERDITTRGLNIPGDRGEAKNGSVTIANQYREKSRPLVGDFGLTPLARDKINPRNPDGPGKGSPFDV